MKDLLSNRSAKPLLSPRAFEKSIPVSHIFFTKAHLIPDDYVSTLILAPLAVIPEAQKKGGIDVSVDENDEHVRLMFKDTGIGLTKTHLKNIFTKFYKADPSVLGTGLGLNIVKENIRLMRGNILVKSKGLGKGSTFIVTFNKQRGII